MALIDEQFSPCAICGGKLDRPYTSTSGIAFPREHPLFRFCDAALHFDCLEAWPWRTAFCEGYFFGPVALSVQFPGRLLGFGGDWALLGGAAESGSLPFYVEVRLREWPCRLYTRWPEWENFINGGFRQELCGQALAAAEDAIRAVRAIVPDAAALAALHRQSARLIRHAPETTAGPPDTSSDQG